MKTKIYFYLQKKELILCLSLHAELENVKILNEFVKL